MLKKKKKKVFVKVLFLLIVQSVTTISFFEMSFISFHYFWIGKSFDLFWWLVFLVIWDRVQKLHARLSSFTSTFFGCYRISHWLVHTAE